MLRAHLLRVIYFWVAGMYAESAQVMAFAVIIIWLRVLYFAKFTRGFGAFCITLVRTLTHTHTHTHTLTHSLTH
jgi:hypothetical protein